MYGSFLYLKDHIVLDVVEPIFMYTKKIIPMIKCTM